MDSTKAKELRELDIVRPALCLKKKEEMHFDCVCCGLVYPMWVASSVFQCEALFCPETLTSGVVMLRIPVKPQASSEHPETNLRAWHWRGHPPSQSRESGASGIRSSRRVHHLCSTFSFQNLSPLSTRAEPIQLSFDSIGVLIVSWSTWSPIDCSKQNNSTM